MDTINSLIDKLYQQKKENASPAHLLFTVQLLHTELVKMQQRNGSIGIRKVSVTLPVNKNISEEAVRANVNGTPKNHSVQETLTDKVDVIPGNDLRKEEVKEQANYFLRKPAVEVELPLEQEQTKEVFTPYTSYQQNLNPAFDSVAEASPVNRYEPKEEVKPFQQSIPFASNRAKEVHELLAVQQESLNDRLKEDKKELAHVLTAVPIKDLRKAVGINERFTLVNDLFKGDDNMYERSIKTINNFHAFSEAEYWINRELKVRLAWDDENPTVQHFYHLVRRRFS
jgi:hypothetical protein